MGKSAGLLIIGNEILSGRTLDTNFAFLARALEAAKTLAFAGIDAEVIDPRTLVPLDEAAILKSVAKTGRAVVADDGDREARSSGDARGRGRSATHPASVQDAGHAPECRAWLVRPGVRRCRPAAWPRRVDRARDSPR